MVSRILLRLVACEPFPYFPKTYPPSSSGISPSSSLLKRRLRSAKMSDSPIARKSAPSSTRVSLRAALRLVKKEETNFSDVLSVVELLLTECRDSSLTSSNGNEAVSQETHLYGFPSISDCFHDFK